MQKIGRNDPCPCGSGKKYKKCHLGKEVVPKTSKMSEPLNSGILIHDRNSLLLSLAALQLDPENHGKNVRLEELIFNVLKKGETSGSPVLNPDLVRIFDSYYTSNALEDPLTSFFTENSMFIGGNYIVYPGITNDGSAIFNNFLESIFNYANGLPVSFKKKIEQGIAWLLSLSQSMAYTAGHPRYLIVENEDGKIHVPDEGEMSVLKNAVFFSKTHIEKFAQLLGYPSSVLQEFIVNKQQLPEDYDSDDFIVSEKPLFELEKGYIFLCPPTIVHCGTEYIKRIAKEENCEAELIDAYYSVQWKKIIEYTHEMQWEQTDIILPPIPQSIHIQEAVFRFDNDRLAYVCLVKNKPSFGDQVESTSNYVLDRGHQDDPFEERNKEVIAFLEKLNSPKSFRYFTLFLLGSIGETRFFSWSMPAPGNQVLTFNFGDLEKVIFAKDADRLTLWKFAKSYRKAAEKTRFSPFISILEAYVMYKQNNSSMLPEKQVAPTHLFIDMSMSAEFERNALAARDEHAAKILYKGSVREIPVIKHEDYAPIYFKREISLRNRLLIESYSFPLWIVNRQSTTFQEKSVILPYVEAIAFWMFKMAPELCQRLKSLGAMPIEIAVSLDSRFLTSSESEVFIAMRGKQVSLDVAAVDRTIQVKIPFELSQYLMQSDNEGERLMMKSILNGFNELLNNDHFQVINDDELDDVIEHIIPLGPAKMILFIDSSKDPRLDSRDLMTTRYIQEADTSLILDNLVELLNSPQPIPEKIDTPKKKNELCISIVAALVKEIEHKMVIFNAKDILKWLVQYNEKYVYEREFREIQIPAKIACFSDFPSEVEKFMKKDAQLANSAVSVRCLIEIVAALAPNGNQIPNVDDLDELMALMDEVCHWGIIADAIHFEMDDPEMGLLASGRIGVGDQFVKTQLQPFSASRAENEIQEYADGFADKMSIIKEKVSLDIEQEVQNVDDAFFDEWGIGLIKILQIKGALIQLAQLADQSVMVIEEKELVTSIIKNHPEITEPEINKALFLLSLDKRTAFLTAPAGFDKNDVYPWKFNRSLSFLRRPLVKYITPEKEVYYFWGFRHLMTSAQNLQSLVWSGRIKARDGGKLAGLLAKINDDKGSYFRKSVFEWLKDNTTVEPVPHEVTIKPTGHLKADKDYGDVDILAVDKAKKIIYSIECKNTVTARVIHEMKTELDKYLGRDGKPGMIQKHVDRDKWLNEHQDELELFVKDSVAFEIKSIILTSEEIPTTYLAKEILPLPIFAFPTVKRKGWDAVICEREK